MANPARLSYSLLLKLRAGQLGVSLIERSDFCILDSSTTKVNVLERVEVVLNPLYVCPTLTLMLSLSNDAYFSLS